MIGNYKYNKKIFDKVEELYHNTKGSLRYCQMNAYGNLKDFNLGREDAYTEVLIILENIMEDIKNEKNKTSS